MLTLSRRTVLAALSATAITPLLKGMAQGQEADGAVAETSSGQVKGFLRNGINVYLGIPYGAPTGGERRFLPPEPPESWTGVRETIKFGQRAPQGGTPIYTSELIGQYMTGGRAEEAIALEEPMGEDCLVVNVLTPAVDGAKRPVMFYMHGGGFNGGSGAPMSLSDRMVSENDIVLVTVNHRLGGLGFLYLGDHDPAYQHANVSILDLIAALEWVRDNIANFGGDPDNVTIYGESGGGAKVALLMRAPSAQGLFERAIFQSGLLPTPIPRAEAKTQADAAFEALGLAAGDIAGLKALDANQIATTAAGARPVEDEAFQMGLDWPEALQVSAEKPMIVGYCAHETSLFYGGSNPRLFELTWEALTEEVSFYLDESQDDVLPVIEAYRAVAPNDPPSGIFFRILGDASFGSGMIRIREAKQAMAPVYSYRFEYDTKLGAGIGAFHTAELPLSGRLVLQPESEELSKDIAGAWTAFARTGDPNGEGLPAWPQWTPETDEILLYNVTSEASADPQAEARNAMRALIGDKSIPGGAPPREGR